MAAVERMSLLTSEKIQSPVRVIVADDGIKLNCTTAVGKASDFIEVSYIGDEVEIGFNNKYLLDALKNAETDELIFAFNGPLKPLKILPTDGDSFVFLVVPTENADRQKWAERFSQNCEEMDTFWINPLAGKQDRMK